ncbi:hypothetical protein L3Q82_011631 [Scortum barcoo]|uniref:Uncharacterized protein n=1 Tax=Scortum barcoo TaxID=214431 RepID=A0ACB8W5E3_9TELE|nr:hypothetical protein L3Q82_011631 [Scortum barcoo]
MRCQVPFSRSIRDNLVLSIQEKVRQGEAKDVLVKKLNCFAKDVLKAITEVAAVEIRALFQSQTVTTVSSATREQPKPCPELKSNVAPAPSPPEHRGEEPTKEPDTAFVLAPPPPETPPAEITSSVLDTKNKNEESTKKPPSAVDSAPPPTMTSPAVQDEPMINIDPSANTGLDEAEEESVPTSEPDSAVVTTPPPLIPSDEDPVIIKVQNQDEPMINAEPTANTGLDANTGLMKQRKTEEESVPTSEPDSAVVTTPPPLIPSDEDPVIIKVQEEPMINAEPTANTGLDEAEEESVPTSEPDSAVVTTPPPLIPSDEDPVIIKVQEEPMINAEPTANTWPG